MIQLFVKKIKDIYNTSTTHYTESDWIYYSMEQFDQTSDKNTTYMGFNALRLLTAKIYLDNIFQPTGTYELSFKVHYESIYDSSGIGTLQVGCYDIPAPGAYYSYDSHHNAWIHNDFPTDGNYHVTISNPGSNSDLMFKNKNLDDVYVYDIKISGVDESNYEFDTTAVTYDTNILYNWLELDVDENADLVLSKSIKDLKNPEKIKTTYSKIFKLPVTKTNSEFFGYLENDDSIPSFNINLKQPAFLLVDGINIGSGNIELKKIQTEKDGSKYFIILYVGEATKILSDLKEKKMINLPLDFEIDTSISNIESIVNSNPRGESLVNNNIKYSFGIMDRGIDMEYGNILNTFSYSSLNIGYQKGVLGKDLIPIIPAKTILEQMLSGYTISGSLLNDNIFKNLVVPLFSPIITNQSYDDNIISTSDLPTRNRANLWLYKSQNCEGDLAAIGDFYPSTNIFKNINHDNFLYNFNSIAAYNNEGKDDWNNSHNDGYWYIDVQNDHRAPIHITGNITVNVYSAQLNYDCDFFSLFELKLFLVYPAGVNGDDIYEEEITEFNDLPHWDNSGDDSRYLYLGENKLDVDFSVPSIYFYKYNTFSNKKPFFKFKIKRIDVISNDGYSNTFSRLKYEWNFNLKLDTKADELDFVYPDILSEPMQYLGDSDVTQLDFIKSLSNMFNLYINVDEQNKNISFDLSDKFLTSDLYDLTDNIILDDKITKTFINNIIPEETIFKFKDFDVDFNNKKYKTDYGIAPGNYIYKSASEISKNVLNINISPIYIFSKSVYISDYYTNNSGRINIAHILRYEEQDNIKHKITKNLINIPFTFLFYQINYDNTYTIRDIENHSESLHIPILSNRLESDPFHITFSEPEVSYTNISNTYDNFFNRYWFKYLKKLESPTSFMITANFWLSALDFINLKLNQSVKIGNQVFYINKISNWSKDHPTKIELYKLDTRKTSYIAPKPINTIVFKPIDDSKNYNNTVSKNNRVRVTNDTSVVGSNNETMNVKKSKIIGYNNEIKNSDEIIVRGSNNEIKNSSNIKLINSNNITINNSKNLIIKNESDVSYINNIKYKNGLKIASKNIVNSGGLNTVQKDFTDATIIDPGLNNIYKPNFIQSYKLQDGGNKTI